MRSRVGGILQEQGLRWQKRESWAGAERWTEIAAAVGAATTYWNAHRHPLL